MSPRFEKIFCTSLSYDLVSAKLRQLEQVLVKRLPKSVHMLALCRIAKHQRFPRSTLVQFHRYSTDADSDDESTWHEQDEEPFIVCIEQPNIHTTKGIILLTPSKPTPIMIKTFDSFICWNSPQAFQSVPEPFWEILQKLCVEHKNAQPEGNNGMPGVLLTMLDINKAKELEVTVEPGIRVRKLEQRDVPEVVGNWKWAQDNSETAIRESIGTMINCAAFNDQGEMVSSILQSPLGCFNVLYTPNKFRRKGFGQLVVKYVTKQAAVEMDANPLGEAETWNEASVKLFESIGYEKVYLTKWFYFTPS